MTQTVPEMYQRSSLEEYTDTMYAPVQRSNVQRGPAGCCIDAVGDPTYNDTVPTLGTNFSIPVFPKTEFQTGDIISRRSEVHKEGQQC